MQHFSHERYTISLPVTNHVCILSLVFIFSLYMQNINLNYALKHCFVGFVCIFSLF